MSYGRMARVQQILPRIAAAALAALAAYLLTLAWAAYLFSTGDAENARRAAWWNPWHPVYQAAIGKLDRAVALNPYYGEAWIGLAERAEAAGDMANAERLLLRAAAVDRTFSPRWALANFYFRREREADFWNWLRLSAERSYGDRSGLFQLAWRRTASGARVLAALPDDRALLGAYGGWLMETGRLGEVRAAIERLIPLEADPTGPLAACEKLLAAGRTADAAAIWNRLAESGRIRLGVLRPEAGASLSNSTLGGKPLGMGFDWRLLWRHGVMSRWLPGQVAIELDGRQMEQTDLVEQRVVVTGGSRYRFGWRARTEQLGAGLLWRVTSDTGVRLGVQPLVAGPDWRHGTMEWRTPAGCGLVRLVLWYERAPGTVRLEGTLYLDGSFTLEQLNPDPDRP